MRALIIIVAGSLALCGCQTTLAPQGREANAGDALVVEQVLAGYARLFSETRRVSSPTNAPVYFAGEYSDNGPGGVGLNGRSLYLFPDGRFKLTEWADIMPETLLMDGGWRYDQGCLRLVETVRRNATVDLAYVPVRFADSNRNVLVLMGTPRGFQTWNEWVAKYESDIHTARDRYDREAKVRTNFRLTNQAEEMVYLTLFRGTYAQVRKFSSDDWESARRDLMTRLRRSRQ